jgi:Ca2+-binding RTX toxin-like protein
VNGRRLACTTALVASGALALATAAFAAWGVAGNAYVAAEYPAPNAHALCVDGARLRFAVRTQQFQSRSFLASHPFDWIRVQLAARPRPPVNPVGPPTDPIVADEIVWLPRQSINVNGNSYAYTGTALIGYSAHLPANAKYLQVWPSFPDPFGSGSATPLPGHIGMNIGTPAQPSYLSIDPTCSVAPPPENGRCLGALPTIVGTNAADTLQGTPGPDVIAGGGGNDTIYALGGDDLVCGGAGNDSVVGGEGNDGLDGGDGVDRVRGEAGNDLLLGGAGDDLMDGAAGDDIVKGQTGNDTIFGGTEADAVDGGMGTDSCSGGETTIACAP